MVWQRIICAYIYLTMPAGTQAHVLLVCKWRLAYLLSGSRRSWSTGLYMALCMVSPGVVPRSFAQPLLGICYDGLEPRGKSKC